MKTNIGNVWKIDRETRSLFCCCPNARGAIIKDSVLRRNSVLCEEYSKYGGGKYGGEFVERKAERLNLDYFNCLDYAKLEEIEEYLNMFEQTKEFQNLYEILKWKV